MDPQAAWNHLLEAYSDGDWSVVEELAEGLLHWLLRGGFPPQTVSERNLDDAWNRAIALSAARFARSAARSGSSARSNR